MTLTNEQTQVDRLCTLSNLKNETDYSTSPTFNTTSSDNSDNSSDSDNYASEEEFYELDTNEYDLVSIVSDATNINQGSTGGPSWSSMVKRNSSPQLHRQTQQPIKQIKRKQPKQQQEEQQQLDLDSLSFIGHSYYNAKGSSYICRQQSLRLRPDEERRMYNIIEKKDKQRNGESTKREKRLRVVRR